MAQPDSPADSAPVATADDQFKLRIDAHALFQLGDQLITDDEQALLELIKNSYDADSPSVRVEVKTDYIPQPAVDLDVPADAYGLIEIEDEGVGMSEKDIRTGWLMISLSSKRDRKKKGLPFGQFNRYQLGDKGLGRLGTMRLGKVLSVETRSGDGTPGHRVTFQWSDCHSGRPLDQVPVRVTSIAPGKKGTIVRIYGLNDPCGWAAEGRIQRITAKLAGLLSPFEAFSNFKISCKINGTEIDLGTISKKLRDTANVHLKFRWENERLNVDGRIKLIWFKKKTPGYDTFIASDGGKAFYEHLAAKLKRFGEWHLLRPTTGSWFLEFSTSLSAEDVDLIDDKDPGLRADPGQFHGEIDYYDLDLDVSTELSTILKGRTYREIVQELAQVFIYRDNFGIRMPPDWLRLGAAWTSGAGYYSLRPGSTLGYIQLTVVGNTNLEEKSDREGFIENPAYRGFTWLTGGITSFVNQVLNGLGKASVKYLNEKTQYHVDEETDTAAAFDKTVRDLDSLLGKAVDTKETLLKNEERRTIELRQVEAAARRIFLDTKMKPAARTEANEFLKSLESLRRELDAERATIFRFVDELQNQRHLASIIRKRVDGFAERVQMFTEMVATGLSAQTAAHDVPALQQQIDAAAKSVLKAADKNYVEPPDARTKANTILGANQSIREMLDIIQPMLRGRRWTGRTAKLSEFVAEYFKMRGGRLRAHNIAWHIEVDLATDFTISINQGRLIQILDNLVSNSEYWIQDHWGRDSDKGRINIEINSPTLSIWDNGPGIRPDLEGSLFEMFVSGKPGNKGNGLGLFITRQLLERDNCTISIDPERNRNDRLFKFVINFSGVHTEKV
jgi:signal transduction histidine kinase